MTQRPLIHTLDATAADFTARLSALIAYEPAQDASIEKVVADMKASSHVKPIFYTDQELGFITEAMAPGVESHRKELARILAGTQTQTLLHDSVFAKLAEASKLFNVVILKTEGTIAYSSVFIELDCAYWNADKEASLREKMKP